MWLHGLQVWEPLFVTCHLNVTICSVSPDTKDIKHKHEQYDKKHIHFSRLIGINIKTHKGRSRGEKSKVKLHKQRLDSCIPGEDDSMPNQTRAHTRLNYRNNQRENRFESTFIQLHTGGILTKARNTWKSTTVWLQLDYIGEHQHWRTRKRGVCVV